MGFFNRKRKNTDTTELHIEIAHECVMKDMPWYIEYDYDGSNNTAGYKIIEPYICITGCGKRVNKVLEQREWRNIDVKTREEYYKEVLDKYKDYIKPRAIVEDMINNILIVKDPDHLKAVENLRGTPYKGCGTSTNMQENNHGELFIPKGGKCVANYDDNKSNNSKS